MKIIWINIPGLFQGVKQALRQSKTKIFCMIRIRRGNFNFSDEEITAMVHDAEYFKSQNADGIVIGCLDDRGEIHKSNCEKLISAWGSRDTVTFHRAFDETDQKCCKENLKIISDLGIKRILTSGFAKSAEDGIENLKNLVTDAKELGISVMPGAGISSWNVDQIIEKTNCSEIHASARSPSTNESATRISMGGGVGDLEPLMICDVTKVEDLKSFIANISSSWILSFQ